ncbi:MAG: phosphotransferase [Bacteroidaceae bacterium]|nr:phosphotransferase [Bacteroidaceae bacterium]
MEKERLVQLFESSLGKRVAKIEHLFGGGGSSRKYFVITATDGSSVYGVTSKSPEENLAFYNLSQQFGQKGLPVPKVYGISEDHLCYLQENLGTTTLMQYIKARRNADGSYNEEAVSMLKRVISQLPDFQFKGASGYIFQLCYPVPAMDAMSIMFDLNYFKYCFVKLLGIEFNEVHLQEDYEKLTVDLLAECKNNFLYRDFQSRNVMIHNGEPRYIDYQGGRRGPIYYDVASFLWQASANYSDSLREELVDVYLQLLAKYQDVRKEDFLRHLRLFVLFRTMQVLGAYGFRGLWEKKQHFIDSIPQAMKNLEMLVEKGVVNEYPYLKEVCQQLVREYASNSAFSILNPAFRTPSLVVTVYSFSYKKGIPVDNSGHGGGYIFDCRGTNNPGRYEEYKHLTGLDKPVIDFLENDGEILRFLNNVYEIVDFHAKRFIERDFTHLMVAFGCTGGQHRSVYCAQHMAQHLHDKFGVKVIVCHREQAMEEVIG